MDAPPEPTDPDEETVQRGHAGRHHGIGTPDCPRDLHHHHDERCEPPKEHRLRIGGLAIDAKSDTSETPVPRRDVDTY